MFKEKAEVSAPKEISEEKKETDQEKKVSPTKKKKVKKPEVAQEVNWNELN